MKILFIITQSEIGGAQRYLLELAPYLEQKGHEIIIAAGEGDGELFNRLNSSGSDPDELNTVRPRWIKIRHLVRGLNPLKDIVALFQIVKIVKREKPDVLFLQSTKAGFLGSLAVKLQHIKIIYRIGGWAFRDPRAWWTNKILFWMEKVSARWKDVIIVNSELDRQIAIDKKIAPAEKIVRIYNGIDPDKLNFLPKEEARKGIEGKVWGMGGKIIIGTIANLYATKGIAYLVEAARILYSIPHTLPPILFIVIGEGKERSKLESLIKKCNLEDRFFLVGRVPYATQYLKAFDIFVLPSVKEGFPWVILEAMAAEVPIVATKVGAVPEVIEDGRDGLLVPPKNPHILAKKIQHLLPGRQVNKSNDRMTCSAKEKLQKFPIRQMLKETEQVLNDLTR